MNELAVKSLQNLTEALSLLITKQREVAAICTQMTIELETLAAIVPELIEAGE